MRKGRDQLHSVAAAILLGLLATSGTCFADEAAPQRERTIYVPFSDLHVLLEQQPKRVLLGSEEYAELIKKAKQTPETHAPQAAVIVSADYAITAAGQRAEIRGTLAIDVLEDGLHALPLDLGSVGLETATLDGRAASIGRDAAGQLVLFVEGRGRHELTLDIVAPLETTAARQVLIFRLPHPAAAKLRLAVSGDVEIKGGANVISRTVDTAAKLTRFELLPRQGDTSIIMTLNSHLQRQDRAVVASSVLVNEVTQAYEKLYATVSLGILYRAVDQFSFVVPEGFEITEVTSPLLARWDVRTEAGRRLLGVKLREQTSETVVLKIAAIRTPAKLKDWSAPRLEPLDVVGSMAVFGLLVEDRLKTESLAAGGVIPISTAVLRQVLPANLFSASPDQPALRAVAAWYAPQSDFAITAQYVKPPAEMAVTTSLLLVVADTGQEVLGGLAFLPQVERRFAFDVFVPAGWQVASVTAANGQPLLFERYADGALPKGEGTAGAARIRVTVPGGMAVGQEYKANFRAVRIPPGWLDQWKSTPVKFPKFAVLDATRAVGAVAVDVRDDLDVRPEKLVQLIPLDAGEKPKYGLADVSTRLAYRYESPKYAASLVIVRTHPRLTARTFSFIRVEQSALDCHYELVYTIAEARTQKLAFSLPKDTPASIAITALDGVTIKESNPDVVGRQRRWNVSLGEAVRDRVRLVVDFQQPVNAATPVASGGQPGSAAGPAAEGGQDAHAPENDAHAPADDAGAASKQAVAPMALPIVVANDVAYQSGLVAVEGCAELEVKVETSARQVDVGELADAEYQPGRRLLGAYGFVGDPPAVKIDVLRHPGYGLYPAIVQECELDTNLSPDRQSETQARFKLITKSLFLQVKLPPDAKLWSAELDGTPLKPQKQNNSLLIDVPAGRSDAPQTLQIVYAAPVDAVASRGTVSVPAPKLLLRAERNAAAVEVPLVDLVWRLHLPSGYEVVGKGGTVATDQIERPQPAAFQVARFLFACNDDLSHYGLLGPAGQFVRQMGGRGPSRVAPPQIDADLRNYHAASKVFPSAGEAGRAGGEISEGEMDALVANDPVARQLGIELGWKKMDAANTQEATKPGANSANANRYNRETVMLQQQYDDRLNQLRKQVLIAKGKVAVDVLADESRSAPRPDEPPIVYPDAKVWQELTARRKEKYSSEQLPVAPMQLAVAPMGGYDAQAGAKKDGKAPAGTGEQGAGKAYPVADLVMPLSPKPNQDLTGQRSLRIDVVQCPSGTDNVLTFHSLGVDPELVVTLTNRSQLSALGWGLALLVALFGVAITGRPARKKTAFVLTVMVLATVVPLVTGGIEVVVVCNMLFYAACLLIPYYVAVDVARALCGLCRRVCPLCAAKSPATMMLIALAIGAASFVAKPQAAFAANPEAAGGPYVIQVVEPAGPVNVPEDAVIMPYEPDWRNGVKDADRVLVPYDKYVELWNRAHPDKKIETKAPPAPYALAGAAYKTLLEGDEYLLVTGQLQIDVFSDAFVQIPLGLSGGVLAQAELDGKPARLSAVAPEPLAAQSAKPQAAMSDRSLAVLYVSGKGRHKLDISVRLKLSRQGGWRVVQGVLPAAAASSLAIVVPKPHTELRLGQVLDRRKYDTEKPDEAIRTALGPGGAVSMQWRPVVAEGQIDRSLTAVSNAVFDVREDGLRLVWQLRLEFRRGQREQFSVNLPAGYLLEKVEGNNVRGWEIRKTDRGHTVEVTLLQPAKDYEQFTLRLWRGGSVGQKDMAQFDVPQVTVADAALHTGQLTIRRSPMLELRTLDRSGVTRIDLPGGDAVSPGLVGVEDSPLGVRPFEAYTFAAVPFTVRLSASPVTARVTAAIRTVLKLAEFERNLESNVTFDVQGRPVYQLRMLLPDDLRLDFVSAPGEFQYAVTKQDHRSLLTIYLANGQEGNVPVLIRGRLGGEGAKTEMPLPRLEVLDVDRQQGDVAVQVDPAFDVESMKLTNCEPVLLGQLSAWLNPAQQRVTRLGLHYQKGDYAGTLRLRLRKPEVACDTITNVRLTDRALEETILLDFTIKHAGIRKLSFLLPATMADSRISVAMLRQKTVEPVSKEAGAALRVTIELQDEEMGLLRVLVENDRLLTPGAHAAPIPVIETGRTNPEKGDSPHLPERPEGSFAQKGTVPFFRMGRRYVVIENAGRDEVAVEKDKLREMDPLSNRQKEWATLRSILGGELTMAYLVATDAGQPQLVFHTESHAAVTTVKARIGIAETTLVVDDNGAYRARQILLMDNATEQFLEIRLPEGAALWTARVAGEAVKPTNVPGAGGLRDVRIPLIKTAPGDLYYDVVLKYGGKMPALGAIGNVDFPLIHCVNITPDLSQVRLYVPKDNQWFDFGGTMGRGVAEEADLRAGYVKFQTKQAERILDVLRQGNKFTKIRAGANLKAQQLQMEQYRSSIASEGSNSTLQSELAANANVTREAVRELEKEEKTPAEAEVQDNRYRLNEVFQSQKTSRARNVVNELGYNFGDGVQQKSSGESVRQFNDKWMLQNKLAEGDQSGGQKGEGQMPGGTDLGGAMGKHMPANQPLTAGNEFTAAQQPSAAQVAANASPQQGVMIGGKGLSGQSTTTTDETRSRLFAGQQGQMAQTTRGENNAQTYERYESQVRNQVGLYAPSRRTAPSSGLAGTYSRSIADVNMPGSLAAPGLSRPQAVPGSPPAAPPLAVRSPSSGKEADREKNAYGPQMGMPAKTPAPAQEPATRVIIQEDETALTVVKPTWEGRAKAVQQADAGLASLDFELPAADPSRWTLYRFTTPLGDEQITVRNVSNDLLRRLVEIGVVAVALLLLWIVAGMIRRGRFDWLAKPASAAVMVCLGLLSLCGGLLPLVGLVALVAGCGLLIQRWTSPKVTGS